MPYWRSASVPLFGTCLFLLLQGTTANGQNNTQLVPSGSRPAAIPYKLLGNYRPSGKFKADPKHNCTVTESMLPHRRPTEVPSWIDLRDHSEASIENVAPPAHAVKRARGTSRSATALESVARLAYGHAALLNIPTDIVIDSKHRLIVTDPGIPAVHVLDGNQSFRIEGGAERRLQQPNSVALDASDNIYIAEGKTGLVDVYGSNGAFLRSLGAFRGEPIFQEPTAVAVGRNRLFVLDSAVHELVVLDLQGNILQRVGGRRRRRGVTFEFPSEIAVRDSTVAVLDSFGSRVQIFDLEGTLINAFQVGITRGDARPPAMGLALDSGGNVYVSNGWPDVRVYRRDGRLLGILDNCGKPAPGIWIDSSNRIYLSDPDAARIKVLELPAATAQLGDEELRK